MPQYTRRASMTVRLYGNTELPRINSTTWLQRKITTNYIQYHAKKKMQLMHHD